MSQHYLLIDYENVQPKNLEVLIGRPVRVVAFVGASQKRLPVEFVCAMQALGGNGSYVRISGTGRNSLDFHIAFTLGQLSQSDPQACLHVLSKDTGFDPLLRHLRRRGIRASRVTEIGDLAPLKIAAAGGAAEQFKCAVEDLRARGNSRPRKLATLANTINALFQNSLADAELQAIIEALQRDGYVTLNGEAVGYHFGSPAG